MRSTLSYATTCVLLALATGHAQAPLGSHDPRARDFDFISVNDAGAQGNNDSDIASISALGRFVAFASIADNLVPGDTNFASDIFVRDRLTRTTERVSVGPFGVEGNSDSGFVKLLGRPDISAEGRFVAFASEASNFVLGDVPDTADVFVRDRLTQTTELISRGVDGLPAGGSLAPSISADGRYVAFRSFSDRLTADGNPNFVDHVFVVDRRTRAIERVDVAPDGTLANGGAFHVEISGDGRSVAFDSGAGNLVAGDGDDAFDVFVRDLDARKTEGISTRQPTNTFTGNSLLDSISWTGRFVSEGVQGNDDSVGALVSADGRFVVFSSRSSNLVRRDGNESTDVFRRDLERGVTERLAADDTSETQPFGFEVIASDITPFTGNVALLTRADLVPEEDVGSFVADVYVFDPRHPDRR